MLINIINIIFLNHLPVVSGEMSEKGDLGNITFDLSVGLSELPLIISITGYIVVFLSLLILIGYIYSFTTILKRNREKKMSKTTGETEAKGEENLTGEVNAAIATALHLYFDEIHDEEDTVLTILRQQKAYKPWSSKLYSLTQKTVKQNWNK